MAYVFGSAARGTATSRSDLDVGVLLDDSVRPSQYAEARRALQRDLSRVLPGRPVDVVQLNRASPLLVHMVVTRGNVLFCDDEDLRARFQVRALQRFDDAYHLRKTYYRYLDRRIRANRLGEVL